MKKQLIKVKSSTFLIIFSLLFSMGTIFTYSYFFYPSLDQTNVGVSASAPFLNIGSESDTININTATIEQLTVLTGIGEAKAKAIIIYREENGSFKSIEEIMNVSGIGEKTFENIKEFISI